MPSIETIAQSFNVLLQVRTFCLVLMFFLLLLAENFYASVAIVRGWEIWGAAVLVGLFFWSFGKIKKLTNLLLPLVFLIDSCLVGLWVSISGGPVSFYMPFFLLILISAIMLLNPRKAIFVTLGILAVFLTTLYLDFIWNIPAANEADKINFIVGVMEKLSPQVQEALYWQQALRWIFFFLLTALIGTLLMRRVWEREEKLRTRERNLEQKRHLIQMGELTGRIAHGVNTPLGLISGNLEMVLAETRKGGKTHKNLLQIEQYVQRAIRTVRDILDYSRQSMSEIRPLSIPEVIESVVAATQAKLKKTGGKLILDVDPALPRLTAYPEGMFQVLLNLVENAMDSIASGGLITLSAHFQYRSMRLSPEDRRGEIRIVVRDTGRGIPAGEIKRIFEPFYSTKGFGKGTGLGLAIVKRIVQEHRGEIKVESRVGEGTVFILLFPTDGLTGPTPGSLDEFHYNENNSTGKEPKA